MAAPLHPLMPHATAAWLVDNSALTFEQIAVFCGLHILEVQAIADDTAATKLAGRDPVRNGELSQDELDKAQADPARGSLAHQPSGDKAGGRVRAALCALAPQPAVHYNYLC